MDRLLEYISHHPWLAAGLAATIVLVVVYELRARAESFAAVSPQDAIRLINQGALLIDLRPAEAFASGHVAGARQMNGDQLLKAGDTLRKHKDKAVVVYDDTGTLGASAARQLAAQGFSKAFNLRGGLAAWRAENLPLTRG
ncbi:MAG: rhodanese-like domain-containing protein [Sinobacteraceae bacterium]|nr:rhodanese-like domain-containing protein [Nevskiaceae bacterium]MBV9911671.1 rhodanese-like domain-containing protein [Nevskiaceae bacterium]